MRPFVGNKTSAVIASDSVWIERDVNVLACRIVGALITVCYSANFGNSACHIGGWPGFRDLEFVDMEDEERISLQQFPWK